MALLATVLWWAACGLTAAAIAYLLMTIYAVATFRGSPGPGWPTPPRITLLKPLCGLEDSLEESIESFMTQEIDSPIRFVFGVRDAADPALELARRIAARHPQHEGVFVVDGRQHGINPKVSNLINMAEAAGLSEVVVLSDSDTLVAPGELQLSIDCLSAPGVGIVSSLYRARPGRDGDLLRSFGAWYIDYWFLPKSALHARLTPPALTYAQLVTVRRDALERIGGLRRLADEFADDAAQGRLVREAGYEVVFSPKVVETLANDATIAEIFHHELRWVRTVWDITPLGFASLIVTHSGPIPLLLLLRPSFWTVAAALLPVVLRWLLSLLVARKMGRSAHMRVPGPFALWLRDQFTFAVWLTACFVRRVEWRGQKIALSGPEREAASALAREA